MRIGWQVPEFLNVVKLLKGLHEENESFARKALLESSVNHSKHKFSANHQIAAREDFEKALAMGITPEEIEEVKRRVSGPKYL